MEQPFEFISVKTEDDAVIIESKSLVSQFHNEIIHPNPAEEREGRRDVEYFALDSSVKIKLELKDEPGRDTIKNLDELMSQPYNEATEAKSTDKQEGGYNVGYSPLGPNVDIKFEPKDDSGDVKVNDEYALLQREEQLCGPLQQSRTEEENLEETNTFLPSMAGAGVNVCTDSHDEDPVHIQ